MKTSFFRDVIKLSTFSIIGQVSSVVALPFITRLFSPDEFGFYSLFVTAVTIIGLLASGMYHRVIVVTDDELEAERLVVLALLLGLIASMLVFCLIKLFYVLEIFSSYRNLAFISEGFSLAVFLYVGSQGLYVWLNRHKNYNLMGGSTLTRDVLASLSKLMFGFLGLVNLGLIYGYLVSQFIFFLLILFPFLKKMNLKRFLSEFRLRDYSGLLKKYIDFPRLNMPSDFLGTFSIQAPIIFIGIIFSPAALGFYALARSVLGIPIGLLSTSIGAVFQRKASEQFNKDGSFSILYRQTSTAVFLLGVIPVIISMLFLESIFILVFGSEWGTAGYFGAILSPLYLLRLVVKPLSFAFVITDHLRFDFFLMLAFAITSIGSLGAGFYYASVDLAVYLISASHSFCYLIYLYFGYQLSKGRKFKMQKNSYVGY